MSDLPKPDVIYRIRNVETRLYLERNRPPPTTAFPAPQMRAEDVTSKRQHWKLTKFNDGPPVAYRIQDPYTAENAPIQALCYNANPNPPAQNLVVARPLPASGTQHNTWTIVANTTNPDEKAFYLLPNDPQGATEPVLGNTIPSNAAAFVGFQIVQGQAAATTTNFLWQISEVAPAALPKEPNSKYRIRAFLGKPLQVDASGNLNLDPTDARGDQRVWTITDKGNGKCTVYSDRAQKFLTATNVSTSGGFDWQPTLRGATEPLFPDLDRLWTFEKTTSLTHTIFINRRITVQTATGPSTDLCDIALALDGNNAILKPKKLAHNEVWLVEPTDTPLPGVAGGGTGPGVTTPVTTNVGIPPGLRGDATYRLRNPDSPSVSNPDHIRILWNGSAYTFGSGVPVNQAVGIRVEAKTNGGVALYTLDIGARYYLGLSGTSIVANQLNVSDNAYAWTITRISLTDTGGRYTIAAASGQLLSTSNSNNLVLANANTPPSGWQVWAFT